MNKTKNLNIDWKLFYKSVFALVIPMALQNLINVGVTATDVIMLGKVGEKVLSGASLAGQVQFIMTLIFYGTTSGATVLTAQYWGKKDTRTIEKILGIGLRTGLTTAVVDLWDVWISETRHCGCGNRNIMCKRCRDDYGTVLCILEK